jgi:hypothetical protein
VLVQIVEMQRSVIELIGLDADYGVSFLNRVGTDYAQDEDLHMKMQQFALCASLAGRLLLFAVVDPRDDICFLCREAMMNASEKAQFYADIPLFLHPFPHVFVFHQQMQQMKAQRQSGPMAQVQAMMNNEETRAKVV